MDVPVTVDFEGGYSENEDKLAENISRLLDLGVIGINFEDRVVKGEGLYKVDRQAKRIAKIRETAKKAGVDLFINARTDVFFQDGESKKSVAAALERAKAYAAAGASGLFVPGLADATLIGQVCDSTELPVNVMMRTACRQLIAFLRLAYRASATAQFLTSKLWKLLKRKRVSFHKNR